MAADREVMLEELAAQSVGWLSRQYLSGDCPVPAGLIEALEKDPRRSARELAGRLQSRRATTQSEDQRLSRLSEFENRLRQQGYELIAGVDEAGVGPMAGPVVAAAVILPAKFQLPGLNDSKKLTEARRADLALRIKDLALSWAIGIATVEEIDRINIYQAGLQAMRRAVTGLSISPQHLLVDARTVPDCAIPQQGIVRGDALSASIAAASIIAKTTRDAIMIDLDQDYPGYGLSVHKGYATAAHLEAIRRLGVLPIHRRSFRPVRLALGLEPCEPEQTPLFELFG